MKQCGKQAVIWCTQRVLCILKGRDPSEYRWLWLQGLRVCADQGTSILTAMPSFWCSIWRLLCPKELLVILEKVNQIGQGWNYGSLTQDRENYEPRFCCTGGFLSPGVAWKGRNPSLTSHRLPSKCHSIANSVNEGTKTRGYSCLCVHIALGVATCPICEDANSDCSSSGAFLKTKVYQNRSTKFCSLHGAWPLTF